MTGKAYKDWSNNYQDYQAIDILLKIVELALILDLILRNIDIFNIIKNIYSIYI